MPETFEIKRANMSEDIAKENVRPSEALDELLDFFRGDSHSNQQSVDQASPDDDADKMKKYCIENADPDILLEELTEVKQIDQAPEVTWRVPFKQSKRVTDHQDPQQRSEIIDQIFSQAITDQRPSEELTDTQELILQQQKAHFLLKSVMRGHKLRGSGTSARSVTFTKGKMTKRETMNGPADAELSAMIAADLEEVDKSGYTLNSFKISAPSPAETNGNNSRDISREEVSGSG